MVNSMNIPKRIAEDPIEFEESEEDESDESDSDEEEMPAIPQRLPDKPKKIETRGRPLGSVKREAVQEVKKAEAEFTDIDQQEIIGTKNSINELVAIYPREFAWLRPIITKILNQMDKMEQAIGRA
jgi:hypothetical protein